MDGRDEKGEKLTFGCIWESFIESTGFHAVNKMRFGEKHQIYRTIFWILLWMCSAGYLLYIVTMELIQFAEYPTTITISGQMAEKLDFPVVTICNLSPRDENKFLDDIREHNYYLGISAISSVSQKINWSDPFYLEEGYMDDRTIQDLYSESKNMSKFIQYHQFDLQSFALTFTNVSTDLGLCVRANANKTTTTNLYGGVYNLHMYLDLQLDRDYYANSYLSSGIKVAVHDKNDEVLMVNEGFVVPPATEAFVEISRKEYKYLPAPYKAFSNDYCQQKDTSYSQSKCLMDCYRTLMLTNCSCVDFLFESNNGTYCSREKYINCHVPTFLNLLRNATQGCDCPIKCQFTAYDTSVSFGMFPSTFSAKELTYFLNESEVYIRKNYISLRIFYKNLQTTLTEQTAKYRSVGDVFSNIGGQMGLFLGASILTITELFEFIVFLCWFIIGHRHRLNTVENKNIIVMPDKKIVK